MENIVQCTVPIPKKMRVLADITLASEEKRNKGKRKYSDMTENNWKLVKTPKVEETEIVNQLLKHGNSNIENVSMKQENVEFETESTKQWCHVCNLNFENLDIHFVTSHDPTENYHDETYSVKKMDDCFNVKSNIQHELDLDIQTGRGKHLRQNLTPLH